MDLSSLSSEQQEALLSEAERVLATQSLMAYNARMTPDYDTDSPFHKKVVETLEFWERGELRHPVTGEIVYKLIIICGPRFGKTLTATQLCASWTIGRNPSKEYMLVSYNQTKINESAIRVRDFLEAPNAPFNDCQIRQDSRAVDIFRTTKGGKVLSVGVDGSLTGAGYHFAWLDDVQKDADDVSTMEKSDKLLEWYDTVFATRAYPKARTCIINTLWTQRDLAYRLMEREPEEWYVLHIPSLCDDEATDPLGRKLGESAWPAQRPAEFLLKLQQSMGTKQFSALFQGRPLASDGNIIKEEWLQHEYDELPSIEYFVPAERKRWALTPGGRTLVKRPLEVLQFVDSSWGMAGGDFSVIATVGTDYKRLYIMDIARGRWSHVELTHIVEAKYMQYRPRVVVVEQSSAGIAVLQSLKTLNRIPLLALPPRGSKIARVEAITPYMEMGQVLWPKDAPWKRQAQDECRMFPNGTFDDVPDAIAGAITSLWANVKLQPETEGGIAMSVSQFKRYKREAM